MLLNSIIVAPDGNASIYGPHAMKLYYTGKFRRTKAGDNRAFVYETDGTVRAASPLITNAENYMQPGRVLVIIEDNEALKRGAK